jgi:hypothetical protein
MKDFDDIKMHGTTIKITRGDPKITQVDSFTSYVITQSVQGKLLKLF